MIFGKLWAALRAQINKVANMFWEADPIAQMRYEYDRSVEQLKEGREGLELYRALVEKVTRQVKANEAHVSKLEAQAKAYLKAGDRETAAKFAMELEKARGELNQNLEQLKMHEGSYDNNLKKIKHAGKRLADVRNKIDSQEAELKLSEAEAEVAKLAESFDFNVVEFLRKHLFVDGLKIVYLLNPIQSVVLDITRSTSEMYASTNMIFIAGKSCFNNLQPASSSLKPIPFHVGSSDT